MLIESKNRLPLTRSAAVAAAVGVTLQLIAISPAHAAVEMFLHLDQGQIKGESRDTSHEDAIDGLAWSRAATSG